MTNSEMNQVIKIAADNISSLRKSDVYRVISAVSNAEAEQLARYIASERPDLEDEAAESLNDILAA